MTTHARQPLRQHPATQTFTEMKGQLDALTASIAEGTRRAAELTARLSRFEEATATKPRVKTKSDFYDEILTAATRRFGDLTPEAAVSAYLATPESVEVFQAYREAPPAAPAPVTAPDPLAGHGGQSRAAAEKIDQAVAELRAAHPRLSREEAMDRVLSQRPEMYAEYQAARREDRAMRGL